MAVNKKIKRYVRSLADSLGLKDWKIVVSEPRTDQDNAAEVVVPDGQRFAKLVLHAEWEKWKPEYLRSTIIHELLHCHFEDARNCVAKDPVKILGKPAATVLYEGFYRGLEHGVDALAEAIAPLFPLPPKGKK